MFDAMDCGCYLEILEGVENGTNVLCLIKIFWDQVVLVWRIPGYYWHPISAWHGLTQSNMRSLIIIVSNLMIDVIVQEWVCHMGLNGISVNNIQAIVRNFYTDNRIIANS